MGMNDRHKTIELGLRCPDVSKSADIVFGSQLSCGSVGSPQDKKSVAVTSLNPLWPKEE